MLAHLVLIVGDIDLNFMKIIREFVKSVIGYIEDEEYVDVYAEYEEQAQNEYYTMEGSI